MLAFLQRLRALHAAEPRGRLAGYIPEQAKALPGDFGIVLATVDGQIHEVGDPRTPFTLQSISKPLVLGMSLEDQGAGRLSRSIGVEPSGDAFNSISLEPGTGRPRNPMTNAGAIATADLQRGQQGRTARGLQPIPLRGARTRSDLFSVALDVYFRRFAVRADCRHLALMAVTLANGSVHPQACQRALQTDASGYVLSVMRACGMCDFSGGWTWRVGLPAKSGVGSGILAVLPGQLGIGVCLPPLDECGTSVRGMQVCEALSREPGLHFLQPPRSAEAAGEVLARSEMNWVRVLSGRSCSSRSWTWAWASNGQSGICCNVMRQRARKHIHALHRRWRR